MKAPMNPSPKKPISRIEFVALMGLMQALQALAVDSMLPALGSMADDLGAHDPNRRQLVVGIFLMAGGLGCLIPGIFADRFGRRPVLKVCLSAYVLCSAACGLVSNFDQLLVLRVILGLFSASLMVMPAAIIRDRFEGDAMARLQSTVAMVFMVVPMIAPSMGQAILLVASWRWIFGAMALLGTLITVWMILRLPETLRPEYRQPIRLGALAQSMLEVTTTRASVGYIFGLALIQSAMFGYINSSQQLVAEHFGAGARFPLIFAGMALMMAVTNFANSRIVEHFGARRVSHTALLVYILTSALQLYTASRPGETLWEFVPMMTVNMCLMGFIGANFSSIALQPFARKAGSAASVQAFIRISLGSTLGALIGQAFDGSARPLATALLVAGISCVLLVLFSEHGSLFRRHNPGSPRKVA